jgi:hypothetical protein
MADSIRYPATNGAVSGGMLMGACGDFDPVSGSPHVFGKIYSSAPTDAKPPTDGSAAAGSANAGTGKWHFNGSLLACSHPGNYTLRVWITGDSESCYRIVDCQFATCDAASAGCSVDCPEVGAVAVAHHRCRPVIATIASRYFLVKIAPEIGDLLSVFGFKEESLAVKGLVFDDARSSLDLAVWSSPVEAGEQLRLEVTGSSCGSCGGACGSALLARVRVGETTVETLERWCADCFDLVKGGRLQQLNHDGSRREGSVLVLPPEMPPTQASATRAAPRPAGARGRARGSSARNTRSGRRGRR